MCDAVSLFILLAVVLCSLTVEDLLEHNLELTTCLHVHVCGPVQTVALCCLVGFPCGGRGWA
jgi:Na+/glutamate symporter